MNYEKKGEKLPNAIRLDLVDYLYISYITWVKSTKPSRSILMPKKEELKAIYSKSITETKVILDLLN